MDNHYLKFLVSAAGYESVSTTYRRRRIKTPIRLWISKVSFGKYNLLDKWWYSKDRSEAVKFSKVMAEDVQKFLQSQRLIEVQVEREDVKEIENARSS